MMGLGNKLKREYESGEKMFFCGIHVRAVGGTGSCDVRKVEEERGMALSSDKYDIDAVLSELCAQLVEATGPTCPFCSAWGDLLRGWDANGNHNLAIHIVKEHVKGSAYDMGLK
jgi:hypothetical protein